MGKDKRNSHGQRIRREERQSKRDQDQQLDSKAICKACVSPAWIVANLEGLVIISTVRCVWKLVQSEANGIGYDISYGGWLRNPAPPKGWLKPYK